MKHILWHFEDATLKSELIRVMDKLASNGINYPSGYRETLIRKYKKQGVKYPRILMRIGDPNIRKHNSYLEILQLKGDYLDYGCGTGDDIRALVNDGYPPQKIVGYDVNWSSINLGFDLYLDRANLKVRFIVSKEFPFSPSTFDIVYSGSVLHVLHMKRAIKHYISNAFAVLNPDGIFFGSTLGYEKQNLPSNEEEKKRRRSWLQRLWWRRLKFLSQESLNNLLYKTGFSEIEISPDETLRRLWFYAKKP